MKGVSCVFGEIAGLGDVTDPLVFDGGAGRAKYEFLSSGGEVWETSNG